MITRNLVKLALVGGLDLMYIHIRNPLSRTGLHTHSPKKPQPHTPTHSQNNFTGTVTVSQETLVLIVPSVAFGR